MGMNLLYGMMYNIECNYLLVLTNMLSLEDYNFIHMHMRIHKYVAYVIGLGFCLTCKCLMQAIELPYIDNLFVCMNGFISPLLVAVH